MVGRGGRLVAHQKSLPGEQAIPLVCQKSLLGWGSPVVRQKSLPGWGSPIVRQKGLSGGRGSLGVQREAKAQYKVPTIVLAMKCYDKRRRKNTCSS